MRPERIIVATCFHPQGHSILALCQHLGWAGCFSRRVTPAFIPVGPEPVWSRLSWWLKVSVNPAPGQRAVKKPFGESLGLQIQCQPLLRSRNPVSLVLGIHQPAMTVTFSAFGPVE